MNEKWYPKILRVSDDGNAITLDFIRANFSKESRFTYAEFGVYRGATAKAVAAYFPNASILLFDFEDTLEDLKESFAVFGSRVRFFGNSHLYNDNYNFSLSKLMETESVLLDYVYLDGAHTFTVDALTYFMCDAILNPGGYLDFDYYHWTLRGSSLDPTLVPEIALQYTQEQIGDTQVRRIVDQFVKTNPNYTEVSTNKIFKKDSSDSQKESFIVPSSTNSIEEQNFMISCLHESKRFLEFGSGYSTLMAIECQDLKIISIETDIDFLQGMSRYVSEKLKCESIKFIHADVGETIGWGWPKRSNDPLQLLNYTEAIWTNPEIHKFLPDLILIDGRFRVATFLMCLLHAPGSKIIFDDFIGRENDYSEILEIVPMQYSVGRIGVFRTPTSISEESRHKIQNLVRKYQLIPA